MGNPTTGQYGIAIDDRGRDPIAVIVVRGFGLWNWDEQRDELLNRILSTELSGLHFEAIRFVVLADESHAKEFKLNPSIPEFRRRQGLSKMDEVSSDNMTAGKTWVGTEFDQALQLLSDDEVKWLLGRADAFD